MTTPSTGRNPLALATDGGGERGPFVFTGTMTPHDPMTGALIGDSTGLPDEARSDLAAARFGTNLRDVPTDAARAQTWVVYRWLARFLRDRGIDPSRVVRQRLFVRDLRDVAAIERMMDVVMPAARPATSIVGMPGDGVDPRIKVVLDAVALDEGSSWKPEEILVPGVGETDRYPQAIRTGPYIWLGNTVGIDAGSGRLVSELADIDPPSFAWSARRRTEERILAQTLATFGNLRSILATQGATLSDIIKVNGWMTFLMRDYRSLGEAREAMYPSGTTVPASSSVTIGDLLPEGALIGYEAVALAPGTAGYDHVLVAGPSGMSGVYTAVRQAGPYVFTCGDVPIDTAKPELISRPEQLEGDRRYLAFGRFQGESRVQVQAMDVYERHSASLGLHGATFDDVVHQTVYMRDPSRYPALERIAIEYFGRRIPPTTLVPIVDTSPYWETDLEIELVAYVRSSDG